MIKIQIANYTESFNDFKSACKVFIERIIELLNKGELNLQILETFCWIKFHGPIMFYDVRDMVIDNGWLKDGVWVG